MNWFNRPGRISFSRLCDAFQRRQRTSPIKQEMVRWPETLKLQRLIEVIEQLFQKFQRRCKQFRAWYQSRFGIHDRQQSYAEQFKRMLQIEPLEDRAMLFAPEFVEPDMVTPATQLDFAPAETVAIGDAVGQMDVVDPDDALEDLQFSLSGTDASLFAVSPTGELIAAADLADGQIYNLTAEVQDDESSTPNTGSVPVTVTAGTSGGGGATSPDFVDNLTDLNPVGQYEFLAPLGTLSGAPIGWSYVNDPDTPAALLTFNLSGTGDETSFAISGSGELTAAQNLTDGQTYTFNADVVDDFGNTDSVIVNVSVGTGGGGNNPPVAVADSYSVNDDNVLTIGAPGILSNDTDADPLTAVLENTVTNGTLTLYSDGGFTYIPDINFSGVDQFTYFANDGISNSSSSVTVTLNINPVNDEPSFTSGGDVTAAEDAGPQAIANWATNLSAGPSDESGQTLMFVVTGNTNSSLFSAAPAIDSSGMLTFTPAADASGSAQVTIELQDDGGTPNGGDVTSPAQTFTITVDAVNDQPYFFSGVMVQRLLRRAFGA